MKFRDFKRALKNEEYNIPDVLQKIKANLPKVMPKYTYQRTIPRIRYAFGFVMVLFMFLFVFTSVSNPPTLNKVSGPEELHYFTSQAEINSVLLKYNKEKTSYINKSQALYDNYTLEDIKINKVYEASNQVALLNNNRIYYLNNEGIVVYDVKDELITLYKETLKYDEKTNVKTLYIVNDYLIVIYNNKQFTYVIKYNIETMDVSYTYTIAATYVSSYIYKNRLLLVSILNNTILPFIKANEVWQKKTASDIGYLDNVMGSSYTILSTIYLDTNDQNETIFLSFDKWDVVYFNDDSLYLVSNHMNYKKNLDYGSYSTILKFKNTYQNGYVYHGSYTLKGSIQNSDAVYEYKDNFRVVLDVTHYNIKRIFLFFKKAIEVRKSINIVNLQATNVDGKHMLEITSSYEITEDSKLDNSISILTTKFTPDQLLIQSRGIETKFFSIDFADPENIRPFAIHKRKTVYSNINQIDNSFGFSLKAIKTSTGEFELKLYDLTKANPVELSDYTTTLNYFEYLDNADYINIDAINNINAYYLNNDAKYYYIGFSVTNNKRSLGTYTLIRINKTTKEIDIKYFENDEIIEKILSVDSKTIHALSSNQLICYELKSDDTYQVVNYLNVR